MTEAQDQAFLRQPGYAAPPKPAAPRLRPEVAPRRVVDIPGGPQRRPERAPVEGEKKLIVGRDISLSGEITSCDKLIVEGSVQATLIDTKAIEVAEPGFFKGTAELENAEIAGRFEGTLTVRQRLLLRSTGRIHGTIRYGQIEIECGGEISGDVQVASEHDAGEGQPASAPTPIKAAGGQASYANEYAAGYTPDPSVQDDMPAERQQQQG